jgi:uncharacterized protein YpmB
MINEATWLTTNPKTNNLDIRAKAVYCPDQEQYGIYSEKTKKVIGGDNETSWEFNVWIGADTFEATVVKLTAMPVANFKIER